MAIRILGGHYRSRALKTPAGQDTRPTRSMVREAVFNMLQGELQESLVLDLFAGSGAAGLEALSRGAGSVVACDLSKEAVACIRANAASLGCMDRMAVFRADWRQALRSLGAQGKRFDLIFLDPPYKMEANAVLQGIADEGLLAEGGTIILEQGKEYLADLPAGLRIIKARRYGDTWIHLVKAWGEAA